MFSFQNTEASLGELVLFSGSKPLKVKGLFGASTLAYSLLLSKLEVKLEP